MIDLYTSDTPNGHRVELMLEELDLDYNRHFLSFANAEHRTETFLQLNPSARIPTIIDHYDFDNTRLVLTQSGAILLYLAEKTGHLIPESTFDRAKAYEWFCADISDIATTRFDAFYLSGQSKSVTRLNRRIIEYYKTYELRLTASPFLAGDDYSIADVAAYPWARAMQHPEFSQFERIKDWMQRIEQRPAVQKIFLQSQTCSS